MLFMQQLHVKSLYHGDFIIIRLSAGCVTLQLSLSYMAGGVVQIALDRSRLQSYVEINPSVATLDDFIESLARAGFFPDDLDDQCEVEISLTRRSNVGKYRHVWIYINVLAQADVATTKFYRDLMPMSHLIKQAESL